MKGIQVKKRKLLSDVNYRLEEISFLKPGVAGVEEKHDNEVYFRPNAVAILLVDVQNQAFILTRQLRLPVYLNPKERIDGYLSEVCSGAVASHESPMEAAIRVVRSEMGYGITDLVKVGGVYTSAAVMTEYINLYISEVGAHEKLNDGSDDHKIMKLSLAQAKIRLKQETINDAKTLLLLQYYFLHIAK